MFHHRLERLHHQLAQQLHRTIYGTAQRLLHGSIYALTLRRVRLHLQALLQRLAYALQ